MCSSDLNGNSQAELANAGNMEKKASDCALRFRNSRLCLAWRWEESPSNSKVGSLVFKVYRGNLFDDSPVPTDLSVLPSLLLWMPSMGHGSSPTTVTRIDVGTYRASNVFFIMPGEWEFRFQVKRDEELLDEAVTTINF